MPSLPIHATSEPSKGIIALIMTSISNFQSHSCARMAAALSYYTIFSLPAVLVLLISIAGLVLDPSDAEARVENGLQNVIGDVGADQIATIVEHANRPGRGLWGTVVGGVMLLLGATGVMAQLQQSLNEVWQVIPKEGSNAVKRFMLKRLLSLSMILSFAFLLLVSLAINSLVVAAGRRLEPIIPGEASTTFLWLTNIVLSYIVVTTMFAVIYRYLPDVRLAWKDVFVGACVTALLFSVGKGIMGIYLGFSDVSSAYGAAGSLALVLVWVNYSSMIFLFGAEFTRAWTQSRRGPVRPESGAVRVTTTIEPATPAEADAEV